MVTKKKDWKKQYEEQLLNNVILLERVRELKSTIDMMCLRDKDISTLRNDAFLLARVFDMFGKKRQRSGYQINLAVVKALVDRLRTHCISDGLNCMGL